MCKLQHFVLLFLFFNTAKAAAQMDKQDYLKQNAASLDSSYHFPQKNIKIIGFGAYHGSAKTEVAELHLIRSVLKDNYISFYFPETDMSIAYYFNEYLISGDEALLNDLIINYGVRVPQERTIEVFNKWRELKAINDKLPQNKKIKVIGADPIVTYKYTYKHLLSLLKDQHKWPLLKELQATVKKDTTDFSPYYDSYSKAQLTTFVSEYESNSNKYQSLIINKEVFDHLIATIKVSFTNYHREKEILRNYVKLSSIYKIKDKLQFMRYGFFHLLKTKEGKYDTFFSMLIEQGIYSKANVVSVLGYLTDSEVIWKDNYDNDGNYLSSENLGDEGIGDTANEYFRGIDHLKQNKVSDLTIYRLNKNSSPYLQPGPDLVEVIIPDMPGRINYGTTSTTDFIDYAILIDNSKASRSIYAFE